ncbi:RNA cap guanine-N2 methyltransferase [Cooperia oncophora]
MGFVPGYNKSDIISPGGETSVEAEVAPETKKSKQEHQRRFPVIYGDDEIFSDIYYDVYDPYAASMSVVLDRKEKSLEEESLLDDYKISNETGDSKSEKQDAQAGSSGDCQADVSFAFDPIRDAHLVAKNAYDAYRDDERIAEHIADRMVRRPNMLIVDAFAGVGVIAIDLDPVRLKCARQNAKVYGVEERIEFICCDFFHFAAKWMSDVGKSAEVDAVFLSPPWGGPSYLKSNDFDLMITRTRFDIYTASTRRCLEYCLLLRETRGSETVNFAEWTGRKMRNRAELLE